MSVSTLDGREGSSTGVSLMQAIDRLPSVVKGLVGVGATIALWELLRVVGVLPAQSAPSMFTIFASAWREMTDGTLMEAVLESLWTWVAGMAVATALGLLIGVVVGVFDWANAATTMLFDFVRPVPAVAFVPLAVVVFGLGLQMELFLIVIATVWPIIYNVRFGLRSIDPQFIDTARSMRLGRFQTFVRVRIPAALPPTFTGIRIAASIAVVLTIVAELVASGRGIGYYIENARQNGLYDRAWAGTIVAGFFGYAIAVLVLFMENRVIRWHKQSRKAAQ